MDLKSSSDNIHPIRGGRGIQEAQVWEAADVLLREGLRPTIERVRQKIGSGSPNTVSPMLERWFATLGKRLEGGGAGASIADGEAQQLPLAIVQAAQRFWDLARREADQIQIQRTEATQRQLDMEREALSHKEAELLQRETFFEQARGALDEAIASSRQAVSAMEAQMLAGQQESARLLRDSEAEMRRLRKALEEAMATVAAVREKSAMEIAAKERAAEAAEERHLAQERRLLSEVDRERMSTRQAAAELAKEQNARTADAEAARTVLGATQQALRDEKSSGRDAAETWARQHQAAQVELAVLRERAASAEQRTTDLASQLQRHQEQSEREIAHLRESLAATVATPRRLESRHKESEKAPYARRRDHPDERSDGR